MTINCKGKLIDFSSPKVMGVLNTTPDSFYDGGYYKNEKELLNQTEKMLLEGATFIDIGAYSSKPGASHISEEEELQHRWDYIYEPDPKPLLDMLLVRFIESQVYQGVVENGASEQAARMVAMKAATDNAGDIIDDLQLIYNKARQAAITQEISEIVAGAAAV